MYTSADNPIRIMIVDDHKILAESVAQLLESQEDMKVVQRAHSGKEAIQLLENENLDVDVIIMDLMMEEKDPVEPDGLKAAKYILEHVYVKHVREIRILIMTNILDGHIINQAHNHGVQAYLPKECDSQELFHAIRTISGGKMMYYRGPVEEEMYSFKLSHIGTPAPPPLTPTEVEILDLIARGLTTREIAEDRGRGVDGIEAHRRNMMKKLGAKNASHMIALAYQYGLIKPY